MPYMLLHTLCLGLVVCMRTQLHMVLQDLSEDEIGTLAVNTLALLRGEPASSGDSERSYPLPSPSTRRRRKPNRPSVRTLY